MGGVLWRITEKEEVKTESCYSVFFLMQLQSKTYDLR